MAEKLPENEYRLVKSTHGHDKGSWYIIVGESEVKGVKYVSIADGRRRKLNQPKLKNVKHVMMTKKTVKLEYSTDKCLRKALWEYNFGSAESEEFI